MNTQSTHEGTEASWISDMFSERRSADIWSEPPPAVVVRRGGGVFSGASWAELLYAVIDLVPAIIFFVVTITFLAVGIGLSIIYVGLPLLALGLLIARAGGHLQRALAAVLLGLPVPGPGPIRRRKAGPIGVLTAILTDPGCWRAVTYYCLKIVLAPITFAFALASYAAGLGGVTYWIWQRFLPLERAADGTLHRGMQWSPGYFVDTVPRMIVLAVVGVGVLVLAPRIVRFFTTIDRVLIASLLGGPGRRRPHA
jgi:hypothetical protein